MDDVDAAQAQIARTMLHSGDWVTPRLDGIAYLEKPPLKYWTIAVSFALFGEHDWAARVPIAFSAILLCWVTARFGIWAFGRCGRLAGVVLATCAGLFLFTRVLISDVMMTLAVTIAIWGFLRATDAEEPRPRAWALTMWASMGCGLLLKGLIAIVFPGLASLLFLGFTGRLFSRATYRRLVPAGGILLLLAIAAPWHIMAAIRNPPYLDLTLHSQRGAYHGFVWFYFINEQLLRYLNLRYPRDYNTAPRWLFWLGHLLWLFPWSVYLPTLPRLDYLGADRASRTRLLAVIWCGVVLVFFTFSTTQEYYSMPCYPAFALLTGCAMAGNGAGVRLATRALAVVCSSIAFILLATLWKTRGLATPGDISAALTQQDPEAYTLSLAHAADLTWKAFAYLRAPLALAAAAFGIGAAGAWRRRSRAPVAATAVMMIVFFQAARLALVKFDPYLSSRPLADELNAAPPGRLIVDDQYYTFSSVFFYADRKALLLNGRVNNLEYGSYAPGAQQGAFIDDEEFGGRWQSPERYYLVADERQKPRFERLAGKAALHRLRVSGGKMLVTNH